MTPKQLGNLNILGLYNQKHYPELTEPHSPILPDELIVQKEDIYTAQIDFLNIDAEAHDFEVLESIDLNIYKIKLICIEMLDSENNINEKKFKDYLIRHNYNLIKIIGPNGLFKLND